jgi:hypothetical protein
MPGIDLKILVDDKPVCQLKSEQGSCDLELPPDGFYTITAKAFSGGNWLSSENSQQVNTYSPCSIDKTASSLHENAIAGSRESVYNVELHIKVGGNIPANVAGFYYTVRTGAAKNRWPSTQDIGTASDKNRIEIATYRQNGGIIFTETAREESAYYVSLFTIYNMGGKEVVSNPTPCRFDRPLTADVFWKVNKPLLGDLKLSVEISGNRPLERIPEFVLCAGNRHLLSHDDKNAEHLLKIPAIDLESPQKTYKNSYDVKTELTGKQLKDTKFFFFFVSPDPGEKFILRWAQGFTGKI